MVHRTDTMYPYHMVWAASLNLRIGLLSYENIQCSHIVCCITHPRSLFIKCWIPTRSYVNTCSLQALIPWFSCTKRFALQSPSCCTMIPIKHLYFHSCFYFNKNNPCTREGRLFLLESIHCCVQNLCYIQPDYALALTKAPCLTQRCASV